MLILAGVSLNAIIGDNGIITNAQDAKLKTGLASLQEELEYLRIKKMENNDLGTVQIIDFSVEDYPTTGFLRRVTYGSGETYIFDLNYIDRINKDLRKNLSGGEGVNGTIYQLRNVYGVNDDFTVWYRDEDGRMYGASQIKEVLISPDTKVTMSVGLMESMGLTTDTANVGATRGKSNIEIDGSKMTTTITNLDDLSLMPNLTWLKLKDLTLTDVNGLQYLTQLKKITFDNTTISNLDGLKYATQVTGFYLINGSVTNANMAGITAKFASMPLLDIVRIRNNNELTSIPALTSIGNVTEFWIEENPNLTNIYGLSTVQDKSKLKKLYLNENNITDVVVTSTINGTYGYLEPLLEKEDSEGNVVASGNVINMSYLDGYCGLTSLYLNPQGGYNVTYEDSLTYDKILNNVTNKGIKYLNGVRNSDKIGIDGCPLLEVMGFEGCDLLDCDYFGKYFSYEGKPTLSSVNLEENQNLTIAQVNGIVSLMSKISFSLDGIYAPYQDTNKWALNFNGKNLTDLSFLDGNLTCRRLELRGCPFDDSQTKYIGSMTNLEYLNMGSCRNVADFSFLASLEKLTYFCNCGGQVSDEDLLNYIYDKENCNLCLYDCANIDSVGWVSSFPKYNPGDIRGWTISLDEDLSVFDGKGDGALLLSRGDLTTIQNRISQMSKSYGLHISQHARGLESLSNCTEITSLYMSSRGDAEPENCMNGNNTLSLDLCNKLVSAFFKRTSIENISLKGCTALERFTMYDMQCGERSNLVDFSGNRKLNYLNLSKNYYENSDLEGLSSSLTPMYDAAGVLTSGCPELSTLYLNLNKFSNFSKLSSLTSLEEFYITDNELVTLSGTEYFVNLKILDIKNNPGISNIQPILDLMDKIKNSDRTDKTLTVYISGCTGILNSSTDLVGQLEDAGVTVVR